MTWTYNANSLASNEKDQVRLEVSDTDVNNPLLQDQEILWAISQETGFWNAAARCAEMISRGFLRKADVKLGRAMAIVYTKMATQYAEQATMLRRKGLATVVPWVGGMSVSDKVSYLQNADIVAALFTKTGGINPWTGGYTSDSLPPVGNTAQSGWGGLDEEIV